MEVIEVSCFHVEVTLFFITKELPSMEVIDMKGTRLMVIIGISVGAREMLTV